MSLFKIFKTDPKLEADGILIDYGNDEKTGKPMRFRVARMGPSNQRFAKITDQRMKPYRRQLQTETMDLKLAEKLMMEIFVDTILLGWENITGDKGGELVFNRENAIELFTALPDLYNDLREQAQKSALFREEVLENDLGNSKSS